MPAGGSDSPGPIHRIDIAPLGSRPEPPTLPLTSPPHSQTQTPLHLQITARQREHPSCRTRQPPRGEKKPSFSGSGGGQGRLGLGAASDPLLPCPLSRKRSPPLGGAPSPSSLSLPPSTGFPLQASTAPSPYLSSVSCSQGWEVVTEPPGSKVGIVGQTGLRGRPAQLLGHLSGCGQQASIGGV